MIAASSSKDVPRNLPFMPSRTTILLSVLAFLAPIVFVVVWQSGLIDVGRWHTQRQIVLVNQFGETVAKGEIELPTNAGQLTNFSGTFRIERVPPSRRGPGLFNGSPQRYTATTTNGTVRITLDHDPNTTHTWFGLKSSGSMDVITFTNDFHEGDADPEWKGRVLILPFAR